MDSILVLLKRLIVADLNQTPQRGDWVCPCNGCAKAVANERKQLIQLMEKIKLDYQIYRGSSFDKDGNLLWMKDDVESYSEGIDNAISIIKERMPKPKTK
jgi:hypothetical protein